MEDTSGLQYNGENIKELSQARLKLSYEVDSLFPTLIDKDSNENYIDYLLKEFVEINEEDDEPIEEIEEKVEEKPKKKKKFSLEDIKLIFCDPVDRRREEIIEGILEINREGYGYLRVRNFEDSYNDVYVSRFNVLKYNLKSGDLVRGTILKKTKEVTKVLYNLININDNEASDYFDRKNFDTISNIKPNEKIVLEQENNKENVLRCIDLFSPICFGENQLVIASPKTGKTKLLKKMAKAIKENHPQSHVMLLLIDERPAVEMDYEYKLDGDYVYSTYDNAPEHQIRITELVLNRAKIMAEEGKDVVILIDSMTRLVMAFNACIIKSELAFNTVDPLAIDYAKRFFSSVKKFKKGGSLTIIATCLKGDNEIIDESVISEMKNLTKSVVYLDNNPKNKELFPIMDFYHGNPNLSDKTLNNAVEFLKRLKGARPKFLSLMEKTSNNSELKSKIEKWMKDYKEKNEIK